MTIKYVKISVFVPSTHAEAIREAMVKSGAGNICNYDYCTFSVTGTGRFRALDGSKPFLGQLGKVAKVKEERIETICPKKILKKVLAAIKKVHPYEVPAIDIYPLLNE